MSSVISVTEELPLCNNVFSKLDLNGDTIIVRGACRSDRDRVIEFLESLDLESVYERFYHIVRDFSSYVDSLINSGAVIVVAEFRGRIVGMAEAVACRRDSVEIGFIVSRDFRGRGVGTALCLSLAEACRKLGFKSVRAFIKRHNVPALRIARKLGASIKPSPEPDTILVEACLEN